MDNKTHDNFTLILKKELIPAYGCTEPIAIAYASAKAREVLGKMPSRIIVACSGNVIKNVRSVVVPSTEGLHGIQISAIVGAVGGDPSKALEALTTVTHDDVELARELQAQGMCEVQLLEGVPNLDIIVTASRDEDHVLVEICNSHTNIIRIEKNGERLYNGNSNEWSGEASLSLDLESIFEYTNTVNLDSIMQLLLQQVEANLKIAEEGLQRSYGANVGQTILKHFGDNWVEKAIAYAAAGSDARMSGCSYPVVINSGSGNQGLTVSMPVYIFAQHIGAGTEQLVRALALSNLIAIYQKSKLGKLSAYCGVVCAAVGAGAAITYLSGGNIDQIGRTVTNTIACVSGIVCDGAKTSCAAKISASVYAAILGHYMAMDNHSFQPGEGLVRKCPDETITAYTDMGREGMAETDIAILKMMLLDDSKQ